MLSCSGGHFAGFSPIVFYCPQHSCQGHISWGQSWWCLSTSALAFLVFLLPAILRSATLLMSSSSSRQYTWPNHWSLLFLMLTEIGSTFAIGAMNVSQHPHLCGIYFLFFSLCIGPGFVPIQNSWLYCYFIEKILGFDRNLLIAQCSWKVPPPFPCNSDPSRYLSSISSFSIDQSSKVLP